MILRHDNSADDNSVTLISFCKQSRAAQSSRACSFQTKNTYYIFLENFYLETGVWRALSGAREGLSHRAEGGFGAALCRQRGWTRASLDQPAPQLRNVLRGAWGWPCRSRPLAAGGGSSLGSRLSPTRPPQHLRGLPAYCSRARGLRCALREPSSRGPGPIPGWGRGRGAGGRLR